MPYTKQTWTDGPAGATPISASRLNYMEDGIEDAYDPPASLTDPGLIQLARDLGGSATEPTVPPLGQVYGGTMAAQGAWVAPGRPTTPATGQLTEGITGGLVFRVGRACTISKLAVQITTAGSAGSVVRLGVYKLSYNATGGLVVALLADAGTVVGTSTGVVELTLPTPLPVAESSNLWLTATGQGTPTTQPVVTVGENTGLGLPFSTASAVLGNLGGLQASGTNPSALPTSPTVSPVNASTPRIALYTSA